jgi:hypothetical protein
MEVLNENQGKAVVSAQFRYVSQSFSQKKI